LTTLALGANGLTNLILPAGLTNLTALYLSYNPQLTNFSFLSGLTNLTTLDLSFDQLTSLTIPAGTSLTTLVLSYNQLTDLSFLNELTNLTTLYLAMNGLSSLTLPAGLTNLTALDLGGNPLRTFVLPEPLAASGLAGAVTFLKTQGAAVYTYPLAVSLVSPQRTLAGAFGFTLVGPPAAYTILGSTDLGAWDQLGTLTNMLGAAVFTDTGETNWSPRFYRATSKLP
jgi:hypothetical protein